MSHSFEDVVNSLFGPTPDQILKVVEEKEAAADRIDAIAASLGEGSIDERLSVLEQAVRDLMNGMAIASRQEAKHYRTVNGLPAKNGAP